VRFLKENPFNNKTQIKLNLESYLHVHARVCASKSLLGLPNFALYLPDGQVMKFVKLEDCVLSSFRGDNYRFVVLLFCRLFASTKRKDDKL
jgi:hypothetical protein